MTRNVHWVDLALRARITSRVLAFDWLSCLWQLVKESMIRFNHLNQKWGLTGFLLRGLIELELTRRQPHLWSQMSPGTLLSSCNPEGYSVSFILTPGLPRSLWTLIGQPWCSSSWSLWLLDLKLWMECWPVISLIKLVSMTSSSDLIILVKMKLLILLNQCPS